MLLMAFGFNPQMGSIIHTRELKNNSLLSAPMSEFHLNRFPKEYFEIAIESRNKFKRIQTQI